MDGDEGGDTPGDTNTLSEKTAAPSYANVTGATQPEENIHHRTQEIGVRSYLTTEDVILAIERTFALNQPVSNILEGVTGDMNDKKKFFITYKSIETKEKISGKGFTIRDQRTGEENQIKPVDMFTRVTFRNVPYYKTEEEIIEALEMQGEVAQISTDDRRELRNGVRTGRIFFRVKFKDQGPDGPVHQFTDRPR